MTELTSVALSIEEDIPVRWQMYLGIDGLMHV